ncbi:MAG: 50S ribosomal protein L5 [Candidatus Omnitrophica bacterium]|nr:50S ribosomal protein L5 [Candidatus Omnitrophota bacterium]
MEHSRLEKIYQEKVVPALQEKFGYKNAMQVPRLKAIHVNMGCGEASKDDKILEEAVRDLGRITGQKPVVTLAKKSIAGFKIRDGMPVGCKVTLRRAAMYHFLDKLISVVLPRLRDFHGVPASSFDKNGNYSMGLTEQSLFPEVDLDKVQHVQGMHITVVTSAKKADESRELLSQFGFPFQKEG